MSIPEKVVVALMLFASGASYPQYSRSRSAGKPNFSGTWKLNLHRSGPIMPRGLEALTMVIEHRDPEITSAETRVVAGKVTKGSGTARIDGVEHISHPEPDATVRQRQWWSGEGLLSHWEKTAGGITYISDIKQTLSKDGKVLTMSEHYREPGMERIRDWVFEKQ
jgi:hypothetical protein